jgi:hypothetical protein
MLNLEAGSLQKGIESEDDISVELPDLVIRTKEQEAEFENNLDQQFKRKYDDGKEKGVKDLINENIEKFGITLDNEKKTFENFAKALEDKYKKEVGKPKDKKLEELETDNQALRQNLESVQSQFNEFKTETEHSKKNLKIDQEIERIKNIHGCHVIANGLTHSLKYYLRLLSDTSEFIENYVNLIENDTALKFEHKKQWNIIISEM